MRFIIPICLFLIVCSSCSIEKRLYNDGFYVHRSHGIGPAAVEDNSIKVPPVQQRDIEISCSVNCTSPDTLVINSKGDGGNCSPVTVLREEVRAPEQYQTIPHDTIPPDESSMKPEWRGAQWKYAGLAILDVALTALVGMIA